MTEVICARPCVHRLRADLDRPYQPEVTAGILPTERLAALPINGMQLFDVALRADLGNEMLQLSLKITRVIDMKSTKFQLHLWFIQRHNLCPHSILVIITHKSKCTK